MDLLCSVFLDLPKPLQAQVFATINSTQKRVSRSLTYELFGYNILEEDEKYWTPDKLAVFLTRKLSTDTDSPLYGKIVVAPIFDNSFKKFEPSANWRVSTAVVVDGILRLFSSNPRRDSNLMMEKNETLRAELKNKTKDRSPLRNVFTDYNDILIYKIVFNYLVSCDDLFWKDAQDNSFIFRTVGVQALFDILRKIAPISLKRKNIGVNFFKEILMPAREINFALHRFASPSGSGRLEIRRAIESKINLSE